MSSLLSSLLAGAAFTGLPLQMRHTPDEQTGFVLMFVLMAATPYMLLVVIGGGIFRARRRQREQEVERALEEQREWESRHSTAETTAEADPSS